MLRRASLPEESGEAPKAHHSQVNNAGALKAQETAATLEGPATKRPRRADSLVIEETDDNAESETNLLGENNESFVDEEDEHAQSPSRWQASEDLSSFWILPVNLYHRLRGKLSVESIPVLMWTLLTHQTSMTTSLVSYQG